jgi:hypothetical protein
MENKKICFKCNTEKPLSDYYKHKQMGDGHLGKCKECTKKDADKREKLLRQDPKWVEKERIRHREKNIRLGYKDIYKPTAEKKREAMDKYKKKYPEKKAAKNVTSNMKPKTEGNELHHWSYNEPHFKDVIELSPLEHYKAHRYMVYDPERKMYRRADSNILLDTKESHIEFINSLKDKL